MNSVHTGFQRQQLDAGILFDQPIATANEPERRQAIDRRRRPGDYVPDAILALRSKGAGDDIADEPVVALHPAAHAGRA